MKKWLVGLMAAGLCAASAWATTDTLNQEFTGVSGTSYSAWSGKAGASGAVYAGKSAGGNNSIQLRTNGSDCGIVTTGSGGMATKVTLAWNEATTNESRTVNVYGKNTAYSDAADLYSNGNQGSLIGSLKRGDAVNGVSELTIADEYAFIGLRSSSGALYLDSVAIEWSGEAPPVEFTVTFDKADGFTLEEGTASSIKATASNGSGNYSYDWTGDLQGTGDTLEIPDTLAVGNYSVTVTVTDNEAEVDPIEKSIGFEVIEQVIVLDYAILPFQYSGPWQNATVSGMTCSGLGTDYNDGSAKFDTTADSLVIKFIGTPGELSYGIKGNSTTTTNISTFVVLESANGVDYTPVATYSTDSNLTTSRTDATNALSATSQYVKFLYQYKDKGNVGIYDIAITSGGPAVFSITLDPAADFDVEQNAEAIITATPANEEGIVGYAWTVDGIAANTDGNMLTLDTSVISDTAHEVVCNATDGSGATATASVKYTVIAPVTKYNVIPPVGGNGFIVATPSQAAAGEDVSLTATANSGYKFVSMTVTGKDSETRYETFTTATATFQMPAEDVYVGATFEEVTGETYTLVESEADFDVDAEYLIVSYTTNYTSALKNEPNGTRIATDETVEIVDGKTITTESDAIVWTIKAGATQGQYTIYNAASNVYAAATKDDNVAQLLSDGTAALAQWTISFTNSAVKIGSVSFPERFLQRNNQARYEYFAAYKTGTLPCLFKKEGASVPTVKYTGDTTVTLPDGEFSIQFSLKGYEGEYTWVKDGREGGSIDESTGLYTWKPTEAADEINITVSAVDGETIIASIDVTLTVKEEPKSYTVEVADGIINGTVKISVGGETFEGSATVPEGTTVTLIPEPVDRSYKLGSISVKTDGGDDVALASDNSFTMPSDNVTVYAEFVENVITGDEFALITSLDGLEDGAEYVITDDSKAFAMKAELSNTSNTRLLNTPVEPDADDVITTDDATIIWKLVKVADGNYAFYNESIGQYIGWSSGNSAKFQNEAFANTISYEDSLFVVMATSTAELEKPRKLQFNSAVNTLQFAYYEGTQKNLNFFKKDTGPAEPSISFMGSTEATLPDGTFTLAFSLDNFENESQFEIEWSLLDNDPGAIAAVEGDENKATYTWALTSDVEAKDYTITVSAKLDGVEIAGEEVTLTVLAAEPPAGQVTCDKGDSVSGIVNEELTLVFTAEGGTLGEGGWVVSVDGEDVVEDYESQQSLAFYWTPDAAGEYTIVATAYDADFVGYECTVTATITDGEPGGQAKITSIQFADGQVVITTDGTKVLSATSLEAQDWTECGTVTGGQISVDIPEGTTGAFYRAE